MPAQDDLPPLSFQSVDPGVMMQFIARSPALLHLDFGDSTVVDDRVLAQMARSCAHLRTLSLRACPHVSDFGLEDLAACRTLQRLDLSFCSHISDEGLLAISKTMKDLRLLAVAYCPDVTESGIEAVAFGCRRLLYMDFSYCKRVTDRGLKALLRHCTELCYLNVRGATNLSTAQMQRAQKQVRHGATTQ